MASKSKPSKFSFCWVCSLGWGDLIAPAARTGWFCLPLSPPGCAFPLLTLRWLWASLHCLPELTQLINPGKNKVDPFLQGGSELLDWLTCSDEIPAIVISRPFSSDNRQIAAVTMARSDTQIQNDGALILYYRISCISLLFTSLPSECQELLVQNELLVVHRHSALKKLSLEKGRAKGSSPLGAGNKPDLFFPP